MAKDQINSDERPSVDYLLPFDSEHDPRVCRSDDQEAQPPPHWAALFRSRSATPISKPGPAKLHGPVSKTPDFPKFGRDLAVIWQHRF